ncbi:MAG: hypothetical protein ABH877_02385 [bacterium]
MSMMCAARSMYALALVALLGAAAGLSCAGPGAGGREPGTTSSLYSSHTAQAVKLPPPRTEGVGSLEEAIKGRRSVRERRSSRGQ